MIVLEVHKLVFLALGSAPFSEFSARPPQLVLLQERALLRSVEPLGQPRKL